MNKLTHRYALALFQLGQEQNTIEKIYENLMNLQEVIHQTPQIANFLSNPLNRHHLLIQFCEAMNQAIHFHPFVQNFLQMLIQRKRIFLLEEITQAFQRIYDHYQEIIRGKVISAQPLEHSVVEQVSQFLTRILQKKVLLKTEVNPDLLGGFIIHTDLLMIDTSLKTQLAKIHNVLKQ